MLRMTWHFFAFLEYETNTGAKKKLEPIFKIFDWFWAIKKICNLLIPAVIVSWNH